ncbi:peptidylprolyl isomerase [Dyadobacter sandarakinus]|uniref:Peptidylprolyl isomerase n=1 Tax=Dyadobacter sandarakinus TaxID=2747268 RepID=A0ABX7I5F2_9BACT|nr:peptidylprolyl isomerase [Dyadobacter sandarakinus]QRR01094.1 peptidylprolyl isomerase [Dyadobacter sandarakinus]
MSQFPSKIYILTALAAASCKTSTPPQQTVQQEAAPVIEIGAEKISLDDFQESYSKNKYAEDSTRVLSPSEYLNLYTDLKIKVLQAKQDGKDTTTDYREEIASYHDQLAKNFLVDKALVEKLTEEAYDRLKQEVRASHILIAVSEDAAPADTLEAYRAAVTLRGRLEEGSDFGDMAARFSKDPAARTNKGDLGYFTAFQTLYPLESAAYALPVGRVSQPVRTRAGYHLIKVTDKRANRGTVQVAHIMVQLDTTAATDQKNSAKTKIDEAYKRLQDGASWEEVVDTYSDDRQSKRNKGLLPPFGTGQMVPQIEEAAFALTRVNAYSKPVLTMYGWHIVRLVEKKSLEPFAVMAPMLRKKVVTDSRGKMLEQAATKRLREKYTVQENADQWAAVSVLGDSSIKTGRWDYMRAVTSDWSAVSLFRIGDKSYDARSFLDFVKRKQQPKPADAAPAVIFRRYYLDYVAESLTDYEKEHLEENNPEFRSLMKEIREGVLLSQMMEEHVWQRSLADSAGQLSHYEKNRDKYRFPERAKGLVIAAPDTQTVSAIRRTLAQSPYRLETKTREILFAPGKTETGKEHMEALTDLLIVLQKNPEYVVEVAGYRAADEPEAASSGRIRSVVRYLNSRNIPIIRIIEKDYGSFRQASDPARNRRVGFQFYSPSKSDVEKAYNAGGENTVMIREGYFSKENPLVSRFKWQAGQQNVSDGSMAYWADITTIEPSRLKTFQEARGSVVNDYQKELEKQWVSGLQKKFPVKVNEIELEKVKR